MAGSVAITGVKRYAHIDAMRAFAVALVVVAHSGLHRIVPGGSGVTIFFTISGFIIIYLMLREYDRTGGFHIGRFYVRRVLKIIPPLITAIVIPSLLFSLFYKIDWAAFLAQILFVFNWYKIGVGGETDTLPGGGVVWSLAIEEQFYIVAALLWVVLVQLRRPVLLLTIATLAALAYSMSMRFILAGEYLRIYWGTDTRLEGLAWGILAAILFYRMKQIPWKETVVRFFSQDWVFVAAVALYIATLLVRDPWFRDTLRYSLQAVAAATVILYGFGWQFEKRSAFGRMHDAVVAWEPIQVVGRASYSIYLAHYTVMHLVPYDWPLAIAVPLRVTLGTAAGLLLWRVLEIPLERWKTSNKWLSP